MTSEIQVTHHLIVQPPHGCSPEELEQLDRLAFSQIVELWDGPIVRMAPRVYGVTLDKVGEQRFCRLQVSLNNRIFGRLTSPAIDFGPCGDCADHAPVSVELDEMTLRRLRANLAQYAAGAAPQNPVIDVTALDAQNVDFADEIRRVAEARERSDAVMREAMAEIAARVAQMAAGAASDGDAVAAAVVEAIDKSMATVLTRTEGVLRDVGDALGQLSSQQAALNHAVAQQVEAPASAAPPETIATQLAEIQTVLATLVERTAAQTDILARLETTPVGAETVMAQMATCADQCRAAAEHFLDLAVAWQRTAVATPDAAGEGSGDGEADEFEQAARDDGDTSDVDDRNPGVVDAEAEAEAPIAAQDVACTAETDADAGAELEAGADEAPESAQADMSAANVETSDLHADEDDVDADLDASATTAMPPEMEALLNAVPAPSRDRRRWLRKPARVEATAEAPFEETPPEEECSAAAEETPPLDPARDAPLEERATTAEAAVEEASDGETAAEAPVAVSSPTRPRPRRHWLRRPDGATQL